MYQEQALCEQNYKDNMQTMFKIYRKVSFLMRDHTGLSSFSMFKRFNFYI